AEAASATNLSTLATIAASERLQAMDVAARPDPVARCEEECEDECGAEWVYVIRGKSFLRYMVRKIVGTILEVGLGRLAPGDISRILELRDRTRSGPTIPPHGLCLMSVEYPEPAQSPCEIGER